MSVLASTNVEQNDDELGFGKKTIQHFLTEEHLDDINLKIAPESSDDETWTHKEARLWKEAMFQDLKNENPDLSDTSLDEYASDYEQKWIDWMEKELGYLKWREEISKIG